MSEKTTTVSVRILEKEYQVACPDDEVEALSASARFLDQQMAEIRESGKVFGLDRIAVMAALNIANEYLSSKGAVEATSELALRSRRSRTRSAARSRSTSSSICDAAGAVKPVTRAAVKRYPGRQNGYTRGCLLECSPAGVVLEPLEKLKEARPCVRVHVRCRVQRIGKP